ncbi:DNA-binding response regulator [Spartobacteria bacterium LR76]|nr:DNA-binding response regulator [Spartobacteria bacterium LR76]
MISWRALIIDDETPARNHLRELLLAHPQVEIVGEASCVSEAAKLCLELSPSLLFLDLQMPRGLGFDLLPLINPVPEIIFVTAYNEYAVRAFEVGAVDYLLKPIFADRLEIALARLGHHQPKTAEKTVSALDEDSPIFLRTSSGLRAVLVHHVTHVMADGNYTTLWLENGTSLLADRTMHEWEHILPATRFVRLDRSLMVNTSHLKELTIISRDLAHLSLTGCGEPIKIGRAARSRLRQLQLFR